MLYTERLLRYIFKSQKVSQKKYRAQYCPWEAKNESANGDALDEGRRHSVESSLSES